MKQHFGINIEYDPKEIEKLKKISSLWIKRPVLVTDETLAMAERH